MATSIAARVDDALKLTCSIVSKTLSRTNVALILQASRWHLERSRLLSGCSGLCSTSLSKLLISNYLNCEVVNPTECHASDDCWWRWTLTVLVDLIESKWASQMQTTYIKLTSTVLHKIYIRDVHDLCKVFYPELSSFCSCGWWKSLNCLLIHAFTIWVYILNVFSTWLAL